MERIELHKGEKAIGLSSKERSVERQCYLLLALPLIGFFIFTIYPILWSVGKSLFYYDQIPSNTRFVGFANYLNIFTENVRYWNTWITTLEFALYKLPFEVPLALILAVLLSKKIKGRGLFRSIYFMPTVISVALSSVIFSNLFQYYGFFNDFLTKLGIINQPIDWFATKGTAMTVLVIGSVWANFGVNVLYFSAALTNVPDDLYEAAEIEGAGAVRKFWSITVPMIAPVFQTILLMAINGTLHASEYVLVMTNGAPAGATHTVGSFMLANYVPGFASGSINIGYGCAMAFINSVIYSLVALGYMKLSSRMQNVY